VSARLLGNLSNTVSTFREFIGLACNIFLVEFIVTTLTPIGLEELILKILEQNEKNLP